MECLLISPLNYIRNINFFLFSFFCHIDICSGHYRNFKISLCQISNLSFYLNEYRLRKIFFLSLYSFFFFAYLSHVRPKFWHKYVITDGAFMIIAWVFKRPKSRINRHLQHAHGFPPSVIKQAECCTKFHLWVKSYSLLYIIS